MKPAELKELFDRIDNGFIGTEEHVYGYQNKYANAFVGRSPVLDIGCGQGAFLRALNEKGIDATGLDLNPNNIEIISNKGYKALCGNAFTHLEENPDFYGGISMFHMIEHFDGETAVKLLVLIYEALKKGGVFCLITPDFQEVGLHNFWLSSTHVRPYPLMWLQNAFKEIGFNVVQGGKDPDGGDTFIVGVK
jgi:2-polyprenyl-3-methyl-5-hydroxy-6-metoxy-1,4-benzoquinol methylase